MVKLGLLSLGVVNESSVGQIRAGLVGQWWHVTPVHCLENWPWRNSKEAGA